MIPAFYGEKWEGDTANREHWVQIITTIPEISSIDHSRSQTTDERIIP